MKKIYITEKQLKDFIRLNEDDNITKIPIDTQALNDQTPEERNSTLIALKQLDNKPNTDVVAPVNLSRINTSNSDILKTESKINNESVTITKKQIKEAITKKRIAESKVYTKKDLKKMCK